MVVTLTRFSACCILAVVFEVTIASEWRVVLGGRFEDRADLAELAEEMLANDASQSSQQPRVSLSYRFRSLEQAEQACDSVADVDAKVSYDGINARCSVSIQGYPSLSLLTRLREATASVSSHEDAYPDGWSLLVEAAQEIDAQERA